MYLRVTSFSVAYEREFVQRKCIIYFLKFPHPDMRICLRVVRSISVLCVSNDEQQQNKEFRGLVRSQIKKS